MEDYNFSLRMKTGELLTGKKKKKVVTIVKLTQILREV